MPSPSKNKLFVVINPASGGGLGRRQWDKAAALLRRTLGSFEFQETKAAGDGCAIAADAARAGFKTIVAYGGDGTVHEVMNGLCEMGRDSRPSLGILSSGTGGDFIKSLEIPKDLDSQIEILARGQKRRIDVGKVTYTKAADKKESRFFINIADAGLGAEVVRRLPEARKLLGRRLAYLSSTLQSYLSWPARDIKIRIEDHPAEIRKALLVVIANGRYFGGGMPIAPTAQLEDGYLDLIVVESLGPLKAALAVPMLYTQQLIRLPGVHHQRIRTVSLTSIEPVHLDIDGEFIGALPAKFEVVPQALEVWCNDEPL